MHLIKFLQYTILLQILFYFPYDLCVISYSFDCFTIILKCEKGNNKEPIGVSKL